MYRGNEFFYKITHKLILLVGFKSKNLLNKNYKNLTKLNKNKSLIKPIYSS